MSDQAIDPEGTIARVLVGIRLVRQRDKSVRKNAFMPPSWSTRISVHRHSLMSVEEAVRQAVDTARLRGKEMFHGWAALVARHAEGDGRLVIASPGKYRHHAEILLPIEADSDWEARNYHAQRLASASHWVEPPPGFPGSQDEE